MIKTWTNKIKIINDTFLVETNYEKSYYGLMLWEDQEIGLKASNK